jgi:hypothetical protein
VSLDRRSLLKAVAAAPLALALPPRVEAADYASAGEVMDAIDGFEADAAARLRRIARERGGARAFVQSVLADHERHRAVRARHRRRLGLPASRVTTIPEAEDPSLEGARAAQEALVYAHAEGFPALGDALAVHDLMADMVDLARHLTVLDLWLEKEQARG